MLLLFSFPVAAVIGRPIGTTPEFGIHPGGVGVGAIISIIEPPRRDIHRALT
jgi:hypothetical protein